VRSAFVVLEQGGVSKGVGYVSFVTREDAQGAFDKIAAEGISLLGRNLRVQWAEKKVIVLTLAMPFFLITSLSQKKKTQR
jgi:RNA recognition motif-containing protein